MSNEYKDHMSDQAQEVLINACVIDKVTKVRSCKMYDAYIIDGIKNQEKVKFEIWFDSVQCEWMFERREL